MSNKAKKILVIVAGVVCVVLLVYVASRGGNQNPVTPSVGLTDNSYYDPYSGETVDYPGGKAPDVYGNTAPELVFLGSSRLLDEGISLEQLKSYEYGAYQHFKGQSPKVTELSIDRSTVKFTLHDQNSTEPRDNISFTLVANRTTKYKASLDCIGASSIQLKLYNIENNSQVFDSGVVTNQSLN